MFTSHDSPVLSLANSTTLVGRVAPTLLDFVGLWVQTYSDFDVLVAKTMSADWVTQHQPVISQRGHKESRFTSFTSKTGSAPPIPSSFSSSQDDHVLYTRFALGHPMGLLCPCYVRECKRGTTTKQRDSYVLVTCNQCTESWSVPIYRTDKSTALGHRDIVAVPFPRETYPLLWATKNVEKGEAPSKDVDKREGPSKTYKTGQGSKMHGKPSRTSNKSTNTKPQGIPKIKTHHVAPTNDDTHPNLIRRSASFSGSSSTGPRSESLKIRIPGSTPSSVPSTPGVSPSDGSPSDTSTPSITPYDVRQLRKRVLDQTSPPPVGKRPRSHDRS